MEAYKNISNELKSFFNGHPVFKILLPLGRVILATGIGIIIINEFVGVGGLLYSLAYYLFMLGLLLTYANLNQKMLYIGFLLYGGIEVINFFQSIFTKYRYLNYHALLTALIFVWIGYLIFKNSGVTPKS